MFGKNAMYMRMRGFGGEGFGGPGPFGGHGFGGPPWSRMHRARRGDVKYVILRALSEQPRHGYDIIRELEDSSGYRISPGSVYPTLQMLEDAGLVTSEQVEGKRVYTITDEGRAQLEEKGGEATGPG